MSSIRSAGYTVGASGLAMFGQRRDSALAGYNYRWLVLAEAAINEQPLTFSPHSAVFIG